MSHFMYFLSWTVCSTCKQTERKGNKSLINTFSPPVCAVLYVLVNSCVAAISYVWFLLVGIAEQALQEMMALCQVEKTSLLLLLKSNTSWPHLKPGKDLLLHELICDCSFILVLKNYLGLLKTDFNTVKQIMEFFTEVFLPWKEMGVTFVLERCMETFLVNRFSMWLARFMWRCTGVGILSGKSWEQCAILPHAVSNKLPCGEKILEWTA